jgi:hypothetical protein
MVSGSLPSETFPRSCASYGKADIKMAATYTDLEDLQVAFKRMRVTCALSSLARPIST